MSDSDAADTRPKEPLEPDESRDPERAPNILLNALVGAAVSLVLAFLPFSTVLGGGVAGYLQGGEYADGAKVGAIAGVFAALPLALFFVFVGALFLVIPVRAAMALAVFAVVLLFFFSVYTVGLSTLGGVLGVYVKRETGV